MKKCFKINCFFAKKFLDCYKIVKIKYIQHIIASENTQCEL